MTLEEEAAKAKSDGEKVLKDLGAELASLRSDFEKAKPGAALEALRAEIGSCKAKIESMGATVESAVGAEWAGFWAQVFE